MKSRGITPVSIDSRKTTFYKPYFSRATLKYSKFEYCRVFFQGDECFSIAPAPLQIARVLHGNTEG